MFSIDIHSSTQIGKGLWMPHALNIVIHRKSIVGERVTIFQNVTLGGRGYDGSPQVGDEAVLYVGCSILGPIRIGNKVKIGAHAVVIRDVPDGKTAVGIPAVNLDK